MKTKDYQVMLSLGYVYIVILGILKEAFYYSQLGIDYFKYTAISDILLSPLSDITKTVYGIIIFIALIFLTFALPVWLVKWKDKKWVQSSFKVDPSKETSEIEKHLSNFCIVLFCLGLMGFYVGRGIGSGFRLSNEIEKETLEFEDRITFVNGDTKTVNLIGKNTSFIFYLPEGKADIEVTPINSGAIETIIEKR